MPALKAGFAGFGTIGRAVAQALIKGMSGLELTAVSSGGSEKATEAMADLGIQLTVADPLALASAVDVVIECAPTTAFMSIA